MKDKKTGEIKEFDKFPDNYDEHYDYVDSRQEVVTKGIAPKIMDFSISTLDGDDYTQEIIENPDNNFLLICYDLAKTDKQAFGKLNDLAELCKKDHVKFIALTGSTKDQVEKFKKDVNTSIDFYSTDGTVLKTMIRSNPGLMLLKAGTVQDKWHYNSLPSYSDLKGKHFKK